MITLNFIILIFITQILFIKTDLVTLTVSRALNITMIYTIASMGLGILMMMGGLISMSSGVFLGLGAYICGNLLKLINMPVICYLIVVAVVGVVAGLAVGKVGEKIGKNIDKNILIEFYEYINKIHLNIKKINNNIKYHVACIGNDNSEFEYNNARCFNVKLPKVDFSNCDILNFISVFSGSFLVDELVSSLPEVE